MGKKWAEYVKSHAESDEAGEGHEGWDTPEDSAATTAMTRVPVRTAERLISIYPFNKDKS